MLSKLLSLFISLPLTIAFILFSVSNRAPVEITLFPLPYIVQLPGFLLPLVCLAVGLLVGASLTWLSTYKTCLHYKAEAKRALRIKKDLMQSQQTLIQQDKGMNEAISSRPPIEQPLFP
jgi:uncharacterized integral membrane protein